jgi:catechol 2,3-dioxygenase-like lactoylglutathione lyase family enzyme
MEDAHGDAERKVARRRAQGPPKLTHFAHVSLPCRDIEEGKRFYSRVLGGLMRVDEPAFAAFELGGVHIGIGSEGCTFISESAEYPHIAFFVTADEMLHMREWLERCGVPVSNMWTRKGVEALMFFRDPSGNVIELFCRSDVPGAKTFPRGPARGHGTAVNIDDLRYDSWHLPDGIS